MVLHHSLHHSTLLAKCVILSTALHCPALPCRYLRLVNWGVFAALALYAGFGLACSAMWGEGTNAVIFLNLGHGAGASLVKVNAALHSDSDSDRDYRCACRHTQNCDRASGYVPPSVPCCNL